MGAVRITLLFSLMLTFSLAEAQSTPSMNTGIEGVVMVSPVHGGPTRVGVPDSRPLANTDFVVDNNKGAVASFTTDAEGRFRVFVVPGHYTVSIKEKRSGVGRYGPFDVDVVDGQMTKVKWQCDTGIR
jgi:hypothetical protein